MVERSTPFGRAIDAVRPGPVTSVPPSGPVQ